MRNIILNIFVNIYTYSVYQDLELLFWSNIAYFFCTFLWYFVSWYSLQWRKLYVRKQYVTSYVIFILSFLLLLFYHDTVEWLFLFYTLLWLGNGIFYFTTIYFESHHLDLAMRDFYASTLKWGDQLIKVFLPVLLWGVFFATELWWWDPYVYISLVALLAFIAALYLISLLPPLFLEKMDEKYSPISYLFPKGFWLVERSYYLLYWAERCFVIVYSIYLIWVLQTEVSIWLYESLISLLAVWLLLHYSTKVNAAKRKSMLYIVFGWIALLTFWLWVFQSLRFLLVFSVLSIFLDPLARTIWFAYFYDTLDKVNISSTHQEKHQSIVATNFYCNISRISFLLILLLLLSYFPTEYVVSVAFFLLAFWRVVTIPVVNHLFHEKVENE